MSKGINLEELASAGGGATTDELETSDFADGIEAQLPDDLGQEQPEEDEPAKEGEGADPGDKQDPEKEAPDPEPKPDGAEPKPDEPKPEEPKVDTEISSLESDPEKINALQSTYEQKFSEAVAAVSGKYMPRATEISKTLGAIENRIKQIKAAANPPDGVERGLTVDESREIARLSTRESQLREEARGIMASAERDLANADLKIYLDSCEGLWPQLKPYRKQTEELLKSGFNPNSASALLAAARSLSVSQGEPPIKQPSREEVVQQTLQKNLDAKASARIPAGAGSPGLSRSVRDTIPSDVRKDLSSIESMFAEMR